MHSIFPLEIEEMILDLLAEGSDDEDYEGHSALKTCSLVCQTFLPICRKHIFGSIVLESPTIHAFQRLLHETPEIAGHIRNLDCDIGIARLTTSSLSIQESLKQISRLESFTVRHHFKVGECGRSFEAFKPLDWSNNPIRPALLHLLHLPTLIYFTVSDVYKFVVSDLIPCVNLKYLHFHYSVEAENSLPQAATFPEHSIQLNELVILGDLELCRVRRPDGQPIIDFGFLSKLTVDFQGVASLELFMRCHFLTNVHISFLDPLNVRPNFADMLRPSMQTLKHIVLNIHVDGVDVDPLFGIPSELEVMRTKNIIESVTIEITVHSETDALADFRRGDDWGRLDEVLTAPGWVSLKQVSLDIEIFGDGKRENERELEVVLRKLPETQFSRLSSNKSVSFDFEVGYLFEGINL